MKSISLVFVAVTIFVLFISLDDSRAQDATVAPPPPPPPGSNGTCCHGGGGKGKGGHGRHKNSRASRSTSSDTLEEKFKDFAGKLGKTPDELRAAFGKFMQSQGVTVQQMEEHIQRGRDAALQMVESIKNAMHG